MLDLEARQKFIGGSDAGSILGVNPWATPLDVYLSKVEGKTVDESPAMYWGTNLESLVRKEYEKRTGRTVKTPDTIIHPKYKFIGGNLDGLAGNRVLEVKTARFTDGWGEEGSDEIPPQYLAQVQHYMMVTGLFVADVAVLIGGSDYRQYEIPADTELQEIMLEEEVNFWANHVETKIPPEPRTMEDIKRLYPVSTPSEIIATTEVEEVVQDLKKIKERISQMEDEKKKLEFSVMGFLGRNEVLLGIDGKPLLTWKSSKPRTTFDAKRFADVNPELYKEFLKTGEASRRLLIK